MATRLTITRPLDLIETRTWPSSSSQKRQTTSASFFKNMMKHFADAAGFDVRDDHRVRRVGDLSGAHDLRMMIQKNDLFGPQRELLPELSQAARIVCIDDYPEITRVPELDFAWSQ